MGGSYYGGPVHKSTLPRLSLGGFLVACGVSACNTSGGFPLELEVKDGAASGKRPDEIELVVKTIPGVDIRFEGQTRNTGEKAADSFTIQKSVLKLGKNTFTVEASRGVLFSKQEAKASTTWDAPTKAFVRFYPTGGGEGGPGALTCGGAMCGGTSFKIGKNGKIGIEAESALAGWLTVAGRKESVGPRQRKAYEIDVASALVTLPLAQRDALPIPIELEVGPDKATETLTLQGTALSDVLTNELARAAVGPVAFAGEGPAGPTPRAMAVVGVPTTKLIIVGKAAKVEDLDLVAVAKPVERFFSCGGAATNAYGILYLDLELTVVDRRTGKAVNQRKLMADRVPCPPTPTAGQIKANVREADITRAMNELLAAPAGLAAKPAK
jgi:hypothetical protein